MTPDESLQLVMDRVASALAIEPRAQRDLLVWLELLESWNARIDLTAARSRSELVDLMLADAALLAKNIPEKSRVVDVGTGAGAPGLALAIIRPDLAITLVEPLSKRVSFLRTAIGTLRRADVVVLRERGDALAAGAPSFDVAISRATLAPEAWLGLGLALAPQTWVLLAREPAPEHTGARIDLDLAYAWPETKAERRAVRYVRA